MTKEQERGNDPMIFARVDPEVKEQAQAVADREFDGNLSMLVRVAVKRFVADRSIPRSTDTDLRVA